MCVTSMVMDHYHEKWNLLPQPQIWPTGSGITEPPAISAAEIAEFRKLLERAREYDKRNHEPECELEEKRTAILAIAKQLGVEITFI